MGQVEIYRNQLGNGVSQRQAGRDDRTGRGAADQVEMVTQPEIGVAPACLAQAPLGLLKKGERNDPTYAAAIQGKDTL